MPTTFSPRQLQVIESIAWGRSNEEIAIELGISPRTVRAHSDALRAKLGVARREIPVAYRRLTGLDPFVASDAGGGTRTRMPEGTRF